MYFAPTNVYDRLVAAGHRFANADTGRYTHDGQAGMLINRDALDRAALEGARLDGHAIALVELPNGLTGIFLVEPATPRHPAGATAAPDDTGAGPRRRPQTNRTPRRRASRPEPAAETPSEAPSETLSEALGDTPAPRFVDFLGRPDRGSTAGLMRALQNAYGPRLDGPLHVLRRVDDTPGRGLPETDPAGYTVVIGAVPGTGPIAGLGTRGRRVRHPSLGREDRIQVPLAPVPAGMTAVRLGKTVIGCYDARMLVIYVDAPCLLPGIVPAWLEARCAAQVPTDDLDAMAEQIQRVSAHTGTPSRASGPDLRESAERARQRVDALEAEIAALEHVLGILPALPETDALQATLERAITQGQWTVAVTTDEIVLMPAPNRIRDPRTGSWRALPAVEVRLTPLLAGEAPLRAHAAGEMDRHPRVFANGFLDAALDTAVRETVAAGDLDGALALIHDVLTGFSADDPDVALIEAWPEVDAPVHIREDAAPETAADTAGPDGLAAAA